MRAVTQFRIPGEKIFRDFAKRAREKPFVDFIDDGVNFIFGRRNAAGGVATLRTGNIIASHARKTNASGEIKKAPSFRFRFSCGNIRSTTDNFGFTFDNEGKSRILGSSMANIDDKNEGCVPGKFYVDNQCIDCDVCREMAPDFFARDDDNGVTIVIKQPTTDEEIALCEEAKGSCPVDAIGDDGE